MNSPPSRDAADIIITCLLPGESLQWAGQPKQGLAFRALDFWVVPFLIVWLLLAIYFLIEFLRQEGGRSLCFTIPFVIFGVWSLVSPFWFDAKLRGRTYYGVSDRRAIIVTYWPGQQIRTVYLKELLELRYTHRSDGTGTLEFFTNFDGFNRLRGLGFNRSSNWWPFSPHYLIPPAFEMVTEPLKIEQLILNGKENALKTSDVA